MQIMEEIKTKKESAGALCVQRDSRTISKVKPKIRIIHIFAPEIIKTDVANFRELVQRLTGKPAESTKKKSVRGQGRSLDFVSAAERSEAKKMEVIRGGFHQCSERIRGGEELWRGANSGSGFLGGFAEMEGFMDQLNHEFPLLPVAAAPHMDAYGESQLA